jgi:hypothetical protein
VGLGARPTGHAHGPAGIPRTLTGGPAGGLPTDAPVLEERFVTIAHKTTTLVSGVADANGSCRVQLEAAPGGHVHLIDRVAIYNTSSDPTTVVLYDGTEIANASDFTPNGNGDVAENVVPLIVSGTSPLIIVWFSCSAGARGQARVQYRLARRVQS